MTQARQTQKRRREVVIKAEVKVAVIDHLKRKHSPEQISGGLRREGQVAPSRTCIYNFIRSDSRDKGMRVHTVTYDNGLEFAGHQLVSDSLGARGYFCRPYHSWEKGGVENFNGLVR
jgi:IS30 family transposase